MWKVTQSMEQEPRRRWPEKVPVGEMFTKRQLCTEQVASGRGHAQYARGWKVLTTLRSRIDRRRGGCRIKWRRAEEWKR